ncbi:MAG: serine/threonine-protein kinase [Myxococcota bacterium]
MQRFGHYVLKQRLGRGGMCEVFRARREDAHAGTPDVALKFLMPELQGDPRAVELFRKEVEISVRLGHPNVVQVYEHGLVDGVVAFLAMELLDGPDLAELQQAAFRQGLALGLPLSLHICIQALRGLDHAHTLTGPGGVPLGLVHRDISPDNLFCTLAGAVKVADFGIAKLSALEGFTDPRFGLKGKLAFMAPERARGEPVDARSDQFSMGLILYELCTGVRPYRSQPSEPMEALMRRVASGDVPRARKIHQEIPKGLDAAIMRALDPRPRGRFRSCAEFADELEAIMRREHLPAASNELKVLIEELYPAGYQRVMPNVAGPVPLP